MHITFHTLEQLPSVAQQLLQAFPAQRFFAFYASMGVGKTTLIKEMCRCLGVADVVCSPTFAIVNEYSTADLEPVYHFDFYRLKNISEAFDLGYEEYFYSGCYCFTEWSEKIEEILPDHYVRVDITENNGTRTLAAQLVSDE